jgi:uncharacterized protein
MLNPDKNAANIAIVQNCYALFFRGDLPGLIAQMTDDIVWESVGSRADYPILGEWKGKEGVMKFFETLVATHEFTEFTPKQFSADGDTVFVRGHYAFKVKKNGRVAEADWVMIFTLKDGLVHRFREHTNTAALAAAWHGTDENAANLALVGTAYNNFAKGNVDGILASCAPDVVWISGGSREDFPTFGRREGIDGAGSFFADVAKYDQITNFEVRSLHAADGKVVALGHYAITATATGKPFESEWAHVYTIVDGKVARFQEFTDSAAFYKAQR